MSAGPELDPLIHAPTRLRIMATLTVLDDNDHLTFPRLQDLLELTAGNLITHLRKLEDAGYVTSTKRRSGASSTTSVSATETGRRAFNEYTTTLRTWLDGGPQP